MLRRRLRNSADQQGRRLSDAAMCITGTNLGFAACEYGLGRLSHRFLDRVARYTRLGPGLGPLDV
jgi:hypothetical protein